jgi:hypothetical protein
LCRCAAGMIFAVSSASYAVPVRPSVLARSGRQFVLCQIRGPTLILTPGARSRHLATQELKAFHKTRNKVRGTFGGRRSIQLSYGRAPTLDSGCIPEGQRARFCAMRERSYGKSREFESLRRASVGTCRSCAAGRHLFSLRYALLVDAVISNIRRTHIAAGSVVAWPSQRASLSIQAS